MESKAFKYRGSLHGHTADVRCINSFSTSNTPDMIISCSRDKTSRLWKPNEFTEKYEEVGCFLGHMKFVSCVAAIYPVNENFPGGVICTGSNDKTINVYAPGNTSPVCVLQGHTDNVCCLAVGQNDILVSGSWDKTARLWKLNTNGEKVTGQCIFTMTGHEAAVWDVLVRSHDEIVVTASADKTIKVFRSGAFVRTLTGHTDCVRGLAWLKEDSFLSCSNDASVRRWSIAGQCLETYYGHRNFVYSVAVLPGSSEFVTSSEDRSIRVWSVKKTGAVQTIAVPAQSPWSITTMQNGDLAVGCSDATIRIFTRNTALVAGEDELQSYENELSKCEIANNASDLGNIDVKALPSRSILKTDGNAEGQTKMVKHDGKVEAYQWSMAEGRWIKIGDVVGANGTNKTTYKGKEYDFVFSVDIEEGKPPLKLPYNLTDDPWMAAQKFINDENLNQQFLETVANFIMDNTKGNLQAQPNTQYRDPFTGSGGYVPGETQGATPMQGIDPFTGGGRHIPSGDTSSSNLPTITHDPMIAPDRYIPGSDAPSSNRNGASANMYFPKDSYILFGAANVSAMMKKIEEFSNKSPQVLTSDDLQLMSRLTEASQTPTSQELDKLWMLLHWPLDLLFPVLDLLRLFISRHTDTAITSLLTADRSAELLEILLRSVAHEDGSKAAVANRLVALRCLCNLFATKNGADFLIDSSTSILRVLESLPSDKNSQSAAASLFIDFAVLLNTRLHDPKCDGPRLMCIQRLADYLSVETLQSEACFRFLVALGTLLANNDVSVACAQSLDLTKKLNGVKSLHAGVEKVVACVDCIQRLL